MPTKESLAVVKNVKLRVKESHKASFDYSVAFKNGDKVKIGREDPEMPGWFWCENKEGVWSWIPEEYLARKNSEGIITHSYDTAELTAAIGETLQYLAEVKLWTLCKAHDGKEGWVPTGKLERKDEQSSSNLDTKHDIDREQRREKRY